MELARTFAEKYAGCIVDIASHMPRYLHKYYKNSEPYRGRIIGYYGAASGYSIVVQLLNSEANSFITAINMMYQGTCISVVKDISNADVIGLFVSSDDLTFTKITYKHMQKAYPNICKKCTSPARTNGNIMLCSNTKCKNRMIINRANHG